MRSILKDRNRSGKEGAVAEAEDTINRRARGLDRAFEILDFLRLQRQPLRPNEIAQGIGAPRSSVYELVNLLVRQGIIEYRGDDGRVFLGRKLYFLGAAYAEQFDLMRESEHLLARIAEETRETAQMCQLEGNKYAVVLMNEGSRPFRISTNIGEPVAIPWTASGRLLVDHMSDEKILAFIPQEDFVLPDGTRLEPSEFIAQVRNAKKEGYFTFNSIVDSFTHCFAVPVYDAEAICIATLCLVAPKEDGLRNRDAYLRVLIERAGELSEKLGYRNDHAASVRTAAGG
ncbi:IclR family transcriptional regulator (plasmid) [Sinorhizobium meliloti]|uniref:IclR family transcriptional regulator n=1 Tax=Rhizobium meliloti TaxID=382 RepID=UPI000D1F4CD3|nr:IclR family transcriptional regulator [Sinorhizobium meliloti]RMI07924.1 IclR family transcriptional regulator [Sinorhizobium meliloti]RVG63422.1 IclR family transcriptional regulator [Sinorhizobium meliloti]RVM30410.1 IclR family transcriptional regulator [Sinorhizobium meliloti]WQO98062.1 IclR family transcriptional regulator [Sinorhizobium meliloti]